MPVNTQDFVEVICTLAEEENITITVKESLKGGLVAGLSTVAGGVIFGPVGLALGGTIGGCIAAYLARGKFVSAAEIIRCMEQENKQRLMVAISQIVDNVQIEDAAKLAALIAGDIAIRERVLEALFTYLRSEMKMEIRD